MKPKFAPPIDQELANDWYDFLKEYTLQEIGIVYKKIVSDSSFKSFPQVSEVLDALNEIRGKLNSVPDSDLLALKAADKEQVQISYPDMIKEVEKENPKVEENCEKLSFIDRIYQELVKSSPKLTAVERLLNYQEIEAFKAILKKRKDYYSDIDWQRSERLFARRSFYRSDPYLIWAFDEQADPLIGFAMPYLTEANLRESVLAKCDNHNRREQLKRKWSEK
jgi:hypothetical protein